MLMPDLRAPGQRPDGAGVRGERVRTDPVILVLPEHWLHMELDLQRFLGSMSRDVHSCTYWLRHHATPPPAFGLIYEAKIDDKAL